MPIVVTLSNHYHAQLMKGNHALESNTLKVILMNTTFAFDKRTHATLADVTADQLATANGYTQNAKVLPNVVIAEDDVNDRAQLTCDDVTWTAGGGSIGAIGSAIIYDDTTTDDTVVGSADLGTDFTIPDGSSFQLQNIVINNAQ